MKVTLIKVTQDNTNEGYWIEDNTNECNINGVNIDQRSANEGYTY